MTVMEQSEGRIDRMSLNAPFGARCFMTARMEEHWWRGRKCLNAPFGARCFMTG